MHTLVIDTSYGSTVGIVGHEPIVEHDSRTHVERLQADVAKACDQAGIAPHALDAIVTGIGPAPFTGLRAGIVAAQALAYATGATVFTVDDLHPIAALMGAIHAHDPRFAHDFDYRTVTPMAGDTAIVTLALNDARRRQLYFALSAALPDGQAATLIDMDIDTPANIAARVTDALGDWQRAHPGIRTVLDIAGHGATRYADAWQGLDAQHVLDMTPLDLGIQGLRLFADTATAAMPGGVTDPARIEPLYLRRPDVSVPNPLKHVLGHAPARDHA